MNELSTRRSMSGLAVSSDARGDLIGRDQKPFAAPPAKRPRDLRLDFFRGIAMFIILIAHIPWNDLNLWIPARFGFSDATEIFVFCSGMASAIAFASIFDKHGWFMGVARVLHRVWQVYWAHIGMFLAVCVWVSFMDVLANQGDYLKHDLNLMPFFQANTAQQLLGLFTLTYVPNYFDILPMYLVILLMIPLVMGIARISPKAALAFCAMLWLATNIETYINVANGSHLAWLRFYAEPWNNPGWLTWYNQGNISPEALAALQPRFWFFNPFGWQLIFFTGFAFMRGWIPKPPVNKALIWTAAAFLILSLPFAYYRVFEGAFWNKEINDWVLSFGIAELRAKYDWLIWKSDLGIIRYVHFLCVGYLAWVACGENGKHLAGDNIWGRTVTVIRTVGQQSLAIFLFSMVSARILGYTFVPQAGHPFHITDVQSDWRWLHTLIINVAGIILLILVAYMVAWFKKQPWRNPPAPKAA